jgi:AcrR family transcriptional regulator
MAKPRVEPRQQRSRETYEKILTVATEIFSELGYSGTTTNKVAEAAGISIGTLYHYFPDKDALLYALAQRHLAGGTTLVKVTFQRLREQQPDLEESLRIVIGVIVRMHVDQFHLHHLLYDSAPHSEELEEEQYRIDGQIAEEVAWHLERVGVANENRRLVAELLVSGVEAQVHRAIIDTTLHGGTSPDPDLLTEVLTQMYRRALKGT